MRKRPTFSTYRLSEAVRRHYSACPSSSGPLDKHNFHIWIGDMIKSITKFAMIMSLFCASAPLLAEDMNYTLCGQITDTSDNILPDVRVAMKRANVSTHTDANGKFTLAFISKKPMEKDKKGIIDFFEIDKDGYQGRTVNITDLAFFEKPVAEKLEPNPIGKDNVGFSARMSLDYIYPPIRTDADYSLINESKWKEFFAGMDGKKKDGPTERVSFHAFVPQNAKTLKAVFLISRHGMGTIDHPLLRYFANRHGIAIVGMLGDPVQRGLYPVSALDEHLKKLGEMIRHPELATVPVMTFGHSNGSGFAGSFPSQRPERVISWVSYHSGSSVQLQLPGVEKVPGLAMHGLIDGFSKNGQEQTVKNMRKNRNAALAMMMEANVEHWPTDVDKTWDFIIAFCEAAMRIRLNEDGSLRPVNMEQGWLGATYDDTAGGQQELAIAPYLEFKGDRSTANWLPDKIFAEAWQMYGRTDPRKK